VAVASGVGLGAASARMILFGSKLCVGEGAGEGVCWSISLASASTLGDGFGLGVGFGLGGGAGVGASIGLGRTGGAGAVGSGLGGSGLAGSGLAGGAGASTGRAGGGGGSAWAKVGFSSSLGAGIGAGASGSPFMIWLNCDRLIVSTGMLSCVSSNFGALAKPMIAAASNPACMAPEKTYPAVFRSSDNGF